MLLKYKVGTALNHACAHSTPSVRRLLPLNDRVSQVGSGRVGAVLWITYFCVIIAPFKVMYGGFPSESAEDRETYLKIWREREGIDVSEGDVNFNPAYYATVKRVLNSLWG